jgi:hypothetical protein
MNFGEAISQVMSELKRPDKATTVKLALNMALSQLSMANAFPRDIVETTYAVPVNEQSDYMLSIPLTTFPGFRRFKYLRGSNDNKYLEKRSPDKVFTREGHEQFGSYYVAGANIQIKLRIPATTLLVGYYGKPAYLSANADTNWMLDDFPTVVLALAISLAFQSIGQEKDATAWLRISTVNARALGLDLVEAA